MHVELVSRLEKLTEPDRELDGMVWCAVNGYEFVMWDGAGCVYRDPNAPKWDQGIKHAQASVVQPYTTSIDAAVAMVELRYGGGMSRRWRPLPPGSAGSVRAGAKRPEAEPGKRQA